MHNDRHDLRIVIWNAHGANMNNAMVQDAVQQDSIICADASIYSLHGTPGQPAPTPAARIPHLSSAICSGVVGRERMGTAFPHKKLSGNGVPTREILRFYCYLYMYFQMLPCHNIPCTSNHVITGHQNCKVFRTLKLISRGTCSIYIVNRLRHKIHEFPLKLLSLTLN